MSRIVGTLLLALGLILTPVGLAHGVSEPPPVLPSPGAVVPPPVVETPYPIPAPEPLACPPSDPCEGTVQLVQREEFVDYRLLAAAVIVEEFSFAVLRTWITGVVLALAFGPLALVHLRRLH